MPVKVDITPRPPANSKQLGVTGSILYSGSKFQGYQRSKGNSYEVEVVLQVCFLYNANIVVNFYTFLFLVASMLLTRCAPRYVLQYVDEQNGYLCGYLKIKGLTEEFPNLTTYFDGEIINKKCPFLTRKWDADEEVDKKHWVCIVYLI